MTYSPTNLFTGSTIPAANGHAQCGKVTPRGSLLAGIVKFESGVRWSGGDRSHAAPTKLVPVRVANWTAPPGEEVINTYIKRKQESFELLLLYKSGDDLLSHKSLQYHRRCWA